MSGYWWFDVTLVAAIGMVLIILFRPAAKQATRKAEALKSAQETGPDSSEPEELREYGTETLFGKLVINIEPIRPVDQESAELRSEIAEVSRFLNLASERIPTLRDWHFRFELAAIRPGSIEVEWSIFINVVTTTFLAMGGYEKARTGTELLSNSLRDNWARIVKKVGPLLNWSQVCQPVLRLESEEEVVTRLALSDDSSKPPSGRDQQKART